MSMFYLHLIQYIGFIAAQVTNSFLLYQIFTKAEKLFGSYRHAMCIFAIYSLVYTWIEIITQPIMHIYGPVFVVCMDSPLKYEKWIGNDITCLYCGSFALCIALLASQFYYRYIAVCHPHNLSQFHGFRLILLFIPPLFVFVAWFSCVYFGMSNTVDKQLFLKPVLREFYGENSSDISFIAPMYWITDNNGHRTWRIPDIMSSVGCVCLLIICMSTILYCAFGIYYKLKGKQNFMSIRTRELNRQLFTTLIFQTIVPFLMMYAPVGLLITLPLFEIGVGRLANIVGASAGVYPAIEPLIAVFCITEFRKKFPCRSSRSPVVASLFFQRDVHIHAPRVSQHFLLAMRNMKPNEITT